MQTTTPTHPHPDVPLPDGTYVLSDWDESDGESRIFSTYSQLIEGSRVLASACATQLPDGSINLDADAHDVPLVFLDELDDEDRSCNRFTIPIDTARKLGHVLIELAAELDRWAGR